MRQRPEAPLHPLLICLGEENLAGKCQKAQTDKTRMFSNLQWDVYLLTGLDMPVRPTRASSSQRQARQEVRVSPGKPWVRAGGWAAAPGVDSGGLGAELCISTVAFTCPGLGLSCQGDRAPHLSLSLSSLYALFLANRTSDWHILSLLMCMCEISLALLSERESLYLSWDPDKWCFI